MGSTNNVTDLGLKYTNVIFVNEGGWHFSYLNTPELIEQKLKSYTHHREYELNPIGIENIEKRIITQPK